MRSLILFAAAALAVPAVAQTPPAAGAAPAVAVGAAVSDTTGAAVGTVSAVANGTATVDTGAAKAAIPVASFAPGQNGLVIAMTKAQLEAAVAAQAKPVDFAVGGNVVGPQGHAVGTVTAATGDLVTVQTTTGTRVQLPKAAFAQQAPGTLVIGLTPAELEAAAKAAGGGK